MTRVSTVSPTFEIGDPFALLVLTGTFQPRLDAAVLFDVDKAVLKPAAKKTLAKLATALKSYPAAAVTVDGYTSSEGEVAHNQTLSEKRANAVKLALSKLTPKTMTLAAAGHGPENPIADNKTEKTRVPNRRVEILVKP